MFNPFHEHHPEHHPVYLQLAKVEGLLGGLFIAALVLLERNQDMTTQVDAAIAAINDADNLIDKVTVFLQQINTILANTQYDPAALSATVDALKQKSALLQAALTADQALVPPAPVPAPAADATQAAPAATPAA